MKDRAELMNLIENTDPDKRKYLEDLFSCCPQYVLEAMFLMHFKKDYELIAAGEGIGNVYVVLTGKAVGKEFQRAGSEFIFREFENEIVGDFEVFGELSSYRVSIYIAEESDILIIPSSVYLKWMKQDNNALFLRVKAIMKQLTYQLSDERAMFNLSSKDRLLMLIRSLYVENERKDMFRVEMTQASIGEHIGVSTRTVQRTMAELENEGLITVDKGKICVSRKQYNDIEKMADKGE